MSSCQTFELKSASSGLTLVTSPLTRSNPGRVVHPAVDGDHESRAREARDHDRDSGQHMRAGRQAVPAVDVDRDEDRLDEEGRALERERHPEHLAPLLHELRPQEAELEREDGAGDDADRKQDQHHLRPALGERLVGGVARAEPKPLAEEHHRREGDAEADEGDVDAQGQRLHLPGFEQILLHLQPDSYPVGPLVRCPDDGNAERAGDSLRLGGARPVRRPGLAHRRGPHPRLHERGGVPPHARDA